MQKIRDGESMEEIMGAYDVEILERGRREAVLTMPQVQASHSIATFSSGPLARIGAKAT